MEKQQIIDIIKLAWPIVVLQFGLQIYALIDLIRRKKTKNLGVAIWIIIIIFGEILGAILYFLAGRAED